MPDGASLLYEQDGALHRFFVESGEDRAIPVEAGFLHYAVSPDGETLYTTYYVPHVRQQLITNFADRLH